MASIGWIILIISIHSTFAFKSYQDYKVYNVTPSSMAHLKLLHDNEEQLNLDFWEDPIVGKTSRIMVSPENQELFKDFLRFIDIENNIIIEDLEPILKKERDVIILHDTLKASGINFEHFWTFSEYEKYANDLAVKYPEIVKMESFGKSAEGQNIFALKISKNKEFGKNPVIYLEAQAHAREWVAGMSVIYLVHQLVENSEENDVLLNVDWLIIPIANPDGYTYSMNNDRMWRKNRNKFSLSCVGVDLNRNFPYQYATSSFCSSSGYPGPHAISESETKALTTAMLSVKSNLKLYLAVHSCGSMVLYPYGYKYPPLMVQNAKEHESLGLKFSEAVKKAIGESFQVGNSAEILYAANGASDDYAISIGARLAYTLELPCGGSQGFNYPVEKLDSLVRGIFPGFEAMGKYIAETYK